MLSITTGTSPLTASLQAQGVSAQSAQLVEKDLQASIAAVGGGATKADPAVVRQVLDTRIASDVASGKLSAADATKISKALDSMAATSSDSPVASDAAASGGAATPIRTSTAHAGGAHGGGGGGGGSSKTEVSETVTVAGGLATTTITYSDGSTETTTSVATGADDAKATPTQPNAASAYAPQIAPGSLVDAIG